MRILITGAGGFVGGHLVEYLLTRPDVIIDAAVFNPPGQNPRLDRLHVNQLQADLRDAQAVGSLIKTAQPDMLIHLAALADVGQSFGNPWKTLENNIHAQVNILEAIRKTCPQARVLVISSAEIYGAAGVTWTPEAQAKARMLEADPKYDDYATLMVKTHLSLSHDPALKGVPEHWFLPIRDVLIFSGAKFLCPCCGAISLMPGTSSDPAYRRVDVDVKTGKVTGLF